ncbi:MAG: FKBP-type peptidyl-prolyl cis-trans isomerase [Rikenellaceae bacterium]
MKVENQKLVALSYILTVDGEIVEQVGSDKPLEFVFGMGGLLPKFEENLAGLEVGEDFGFTLTAAESYGEIIAEAVVPLPKSVFEVEGKIDEEVIKVGNVLPMMDSDGNRLMGTVKEINEENVVMDFNHPMAGKTLCFNGSVVDVREATAEDMAKFTAPAGGCGGGCEGGCDEQGSCCSDGGDCGCN